MSKSKKRAKKEQRPAKKDFKKVVARVGRKKRDASNVTRADPKIKRVTVRPQLAFDSKDAVTHRNLSLRDLIPQVEHHNPSIRRDALMGLRELLPTLCAGEDAPRVDRRGGEGLPSPISGGWKGRMVHAMTVSVSDEVAAVRQEGRLLLRAVMKPEIDGPPTPVPLSHVVALLHAQKGALTHVSQAIRFDAVPLIRAMLDCISIRGVLDNVAHQETPVLLVVREVMELLVQLLDELIEVSNFDAIEQVLDLITTFIRFGTLESHPPLTSHRAQTWRTHGLIPPLEAQGAYDLALRAGHKSMDVWEFMQSLIALAASPAEGTRKSRTRKGAAPVVIQSTRRETIQSLCIRLLSALNKVRERWPPDGEGNADYDSLIASRATRTFLTPC
eukprot:Polyplicarium_translucidae@DN2249_c0_g1_i2.p2